MLELDVNAFAVPAHHWHANRRAGYVYALIAQDFLGFIPHLHLLSRVPVVAENIAMRQAVQINWVGINRCFDRLPSALRFELYDGRFARSGDALVRAHHAALDAERVVQGFEHHHELHRRAIRVGDDTVIRTDDVTVDFRHHERTIRIHAPGTAVVNDCDSRLGKFGRPLFGHIPASAEQRHLRAASTSSTFCTVHFRP